MKCALTEKITLTNLSYILYSYILIFIGINIFNIFYAAHCFIDIVEHIHASYFINIGLIPYKDFFQHHNPLLWFLLAPLTKLLYHNIAIFYVVRFIALLFNLINIWLIYKITERFLYNKKIAQISILLLLSIPYIWCEATVIRPDIFMYTCFLAALYLFFYYLENKKTFILALSYTLLSISFLFLQKILPLCTVLLITNFYFIYKKKLSLQSFFIASLIATIPLILFCIYLHINGAFADWFYYNFKFNLYMKEYYNGYVSGVARIVVYSSLLIFVIIVNNKPSTRNAYIIYSLYAISATMLFYWHPHIQYYLPYFIFSAPLIGKIAEKKFEQPKFIVILFFCFIFATYSIYPSAKSQKDYQENLFLAQFIIDKTSKQKTFFDLDKDPVDIFNKPHHYHWFGYHNIVIIDILTHPTHMLDLNQLLKDAKPEYIHYEAHTFPGLNDMLTHRNSYPFIRRNRYIIKKARNFPDLLQKIIYIDSDFHKIDKKWIEENYHQTKIKGLWQKSAIKN